MRWCCISGRVMGKGVRDAHTGTCSSIRCLPLCKLHAHNDMGTRACARAPWRPQVGVVGRTGSGKTTLLMALYRFFELTHGRILIDGFNIAAVPLREVRSLVARRRLHPAGSAPRPLVPARQYVPARGLGMVPGAVWPLAARARHAGHFAVGARRALLPGCVAQGSRLGTGRPATPAHAHGCAHVRADALAAGHHSPRARYVFGHGTHQPGPI